MTYCLLFVLSPCLPTQTGLLSIFLFTLLSPATKWLLVYNRCFLNIWQINVQMTVATSDVWITNDKNVECRNTNKWNTNLEKHFQTSRNIFTTFSNYLRRASVYSWLWPAGSARKFCCSAAQSCPTLWPHGLRTHSKGSEHIQVHWKQLLWTTTRREGL